jgi:hypothetical protein
MDRIVQVEVEFTIRHTLEELKDEFVQRGHFPEWRADKLVTDDGSNKLFFSETRVIGRNLRNEQDRYDWLVFSMEACGELQRRVVIHNPISSTLKIDGQDLEAFLHTCRECLVSTSDGHS